MSATTSYAAEVANAVTTVTLTAMTTADGASVSAVTLSGIAIADSDFTDGITVPSLLVGDNAIVVTVTAEDGSTTQPYTVTVTRAGIPVTIEAEHESIGGGVEDLKFTLTRTGATTVALPVTVTLTQDQNWLTSTYLTHEVEFAAGEATKELMIEDSRFSFDPTTSGNLVATVTGTGVAGGTDTVTVISIADPPITIVFDQDAYSFPEGGPADEVNIYLTATLDAAFPRKPSSDFSIAISTRGGTATAPEDYATFARLPPFTPTDFTANTDGQQAASLLFGPSAGNPLVIVDDDVYEVDETFNVKIEITPDFRTGLARAKKADGTFCAFQFGSGGCSSVSYPVTITDDDLPTLSLAAAPASIAEEDDATTTGTVENVSTVTASIGNGKTFAVDQELTLTFTGTATYGTHYAVTPADTDGNTTGHQVTLTAGQTSVDVTVTAVGNSTADDDRDITIAGTRDGTAFGNATIVVRDDETTTTSTDAATGKPTIFGMAQAGAELTANTDGISDPDGKTKAESGDAGYAYTYQWVRVDSNGTSNETDIGSDSSTYTLLAADVGKKIWVKVSFTDDADNVEGPLTSDAYPASGTVAAAPNAAPAFTSSATFTAAENQTAVGTVTATDSDGDSVTDYAIAGGADQAAFSIVALTGVLTFTAAPNFEDATDADDSNTYEVVVRATSGTDARVKTADQPITVTVTNEAGEAPGVPEAPTVSSASVTSVTVTWAAPSNEGPAITGYDLQYRIMGTSGDFTVGPEDVTGLSEPIPGLAEDTEYEVQVRATNAEGDSGWSEAGSGSTDANAAPAFTSSATFDAAENQTAVGTVTATDSDGDSVTDYAIAGGADQAAFSIVALTGVLTFTAAPNFEDATDADDSNTYEVEVRATSGTGARVKTADQPITVTVTDVDTEAPGVPEAPTVTSASVTSVTVTWAAPSNEGPAITSYDLQYRIMGTSGDFTVGPQDVSGPSEPIPGLAEDTEYEVQVRATNAEGDSDWSEAGSGSTDANAAPAFTSSATFDAAENQTAVGTVTATDSDGDSVTDYAIAGGADQAAFSIVALTGVLTFTAAPNFEDATDADDSNTYEVEVRATSGTGARVKTADQPITVTVTNVDTEAPGVPEAPTVTSASVTSVTVTWAAPSNEGPAITSYDLQYRIMGTSGDFTVGPQDVSGPSEPIPGLAEDTEYEVQVRATNAEGDSGWSEAGSGSTDANAAPAFTSSATFDAAENQTAAGTVTATDSDGDSVTDYAIAGGADQAAFSIVALTGVLTFTAAPNFEDATDADDSNTYEVEVRATSGTGARVKTADQPITVTVTDVDTEAPGVPEAPTVTSASVTSVTVTWAAPSNEGPAITGYDLQYRIMGTSGDFTVGPEDVTGLSEPIPGLAEDTEYEVQVRATNAEGDSGWSEAGSGSTDANAAPAFTSSATFDAAENQTAVGTVTATDSDGDSVTDYAIAGGADQAAFSIVALTGVLTFTAAPNFEDATDADDSNTYEVEVRATSGTGARVKTADQPITVTVTNEAGEAPGVPAKPTVTSASVTSVTVTWAAPSNEGPAITSYDLQYRIMGTSGDFTVGPQDVSGPSEPIPGLAEDTEYEVQVRATNAEGDSGWSEAGSGSTDANAAPAFTSSATFDAAENQTAAGTVTATDSDDSVTGYTITGGADQLTFSIVPLTGVLTFRAAPNFEDATDADTDNDYVVEVRATSGTGERVKTVDQTIAVTVTNVDGEAPGVPDAPTVSSASVTSVTVTWAAPANPGPAITSYDLQYRIMGTSGAFTAWTEDVTGRSATITALEEDTEYEVQVQATNDEGTGGWSDSGSGSTDANAAPVFTTPATFTAAENQTAVGTVTATDSDDSVTGYTIEGGADASTFSILLLTGELTFTAAPNFEAPTDGGGNNNYLVVVRATSGTGERKKTADQPIAVTVTNVDGEAPGVPATPTVTSASVTSVTVTWAAPSNEGPAITSYDLQYRVGNSGDFTPWTEDVTGRSATITGLEENTEYEVQVLATNDDGDSGWSDSGSGATDANAAPVFTTPATFTAAENQTAVGTVTATDSDDSVTGYTIEGGADASTFSIVSATGELTFTAAPNFEAPTDGGGNNNYLVLVRATSGTGERKKTADQTIAVTVTNVDGEAPGVPDAPTVTAASVTSVTVTWAAPSNEGPAITSYDLQYRVGNSGDFTPWTEDVTGRSATITGLEENTEYEVQVLATNDDGDSGWSDSGSGATDANAAPVFTTPATFTAAENQTAVGTVAATDSDDSVTGYTIEGGADASTFSIVSATGVLTFTAAPNFEAPTDGGGNNNYLVLVRATSGTGERKKTADQPIAVTVTNVDGEAPGVPATPTVTSASVTSVTVTWAAPSNPGPAITSYDLQYRVGNSGDFTPWTEDVTGRSATITGLEENTEYEVQVLATNDDGDSGWSDSGSGATDANAAPVFTSPATFTAAENQTAVGTVAATDSDDSVTGYTIEGGADASTFSIVSATGELTFTAAPNFEAPTDGGGNNNYLVLVRATSGTGERKKTADQTIAVTVTNVDGEAPGVPDAPTVTAASVTSVTVTWAAPSNEGPAITSYDLQYRVGNSGDFTPWTEDVTGRSATITGLEENTEYEVQVLATNDDGDSGWSDSGSGATDANAAPVFTTPATFTAAENQTAVGTVTATDSDDSVTGYTIEGGADASTFSILLLTGELTFTAAPNFEAPTDGGGNNNYLVLVRATSGTGERKKTADQPIAVTVTNVDGEAPGVPATPTVTSASVTSVTVTWAAPSNEGPAITSYDLQYRVGNSGDFTPWTEDVTGRSATITGLEENTEYEVQVLATNDDGDSGWSDSGSGATDANAAPVFTTPATFTAAENQTAVGTVAATDSDDSVTGYTIEGGADASTFSILLLTGELTFTAAPNFEAPTDGGGNNNYLVLVRATSGTGERKKTADQSIAVTVTNVAGEAPGVPDAPTVSSASVTSVTVTWAAPSNEGPAITSYDLQYRVGDSGDFTPWTEDVTGRSATITGLEENTEYEVQVLATNDDGDSGWSDSGSGATDANAAPLFTSPSAFTAAENQTAVGTVAATDGDSGDSVTDYTITGGADQLKFSIVPLTGVLTFTAAPNFEDATDADDSNTYEVVVRATSGTDARVKTADQPITVTVTNEAGEAPGVPAKPTVTSASVTSVTVTWAAPSNEGPAITSYDLQYRIMGTSGDFTVGPQDVSGPSEPIPGLAEDTEYEVQVRATNAEGDSGWSEAGSGSTDANAAPAFTSSATFDAAENQTAAGTVTATDSDDSVTGYTITGGADQLTFSIVPLTGVLTFRAAPNFEDATDADTDNDYVVEVRATSGTGERVKTVDQTIAVTVTNVDGEAPGVPDAPTVSSASVTSVTVTWAAPANPGPAITSYDLQYRIMGTSGAFTAWTEDVTGRSATITGLEEDTEYEVQVQATNDEGTGGWSDSGSGSTDANAAPVFTTPATFTAAENQTAVGTVTATDSDDSVTGYTIEGGADASTFSILLLTGELTFTAAPNFEAPTDGGGNNNYLVLVRATSGTGERKKTADQPIAVTVTNVDGEAPGVPATPTVTSASVTSVTVTWAAPSNEGPAITSYDLQYRVGNSGDFTPWTEDVTGRSATITGLEENTEYEVQVLATNDDGDSGWSDSGSGATDANAAPLFTSPATFTAAENQTAVGTVAATDSDDSVTGYTIEGGADASTFSILLLTGELTFTAAPNFEAPTDGGGNNNYLVLVRATSGTGERKKTADQSIAVTVTNVDGEAPGVPDAPTVTAASVTSVTVTWAAPSNPGPAITSYDLQYRVGNSGDFTAWTEDVTGRSATITGLEENTEYEVQVLATNDDGDSGWSDSGSGATDANAAPLFTSPATFDAAENQTTVGTVTATDSDDSVTGYTIEGGADASTFSILLLTGELTFTAAPNFEAPTDGGGNNNYLVVVRATSGTGARVKTADQTIAVTVTNVAGEAPGVPDAPTVSSASATSVTVNWTAPSNPGPAITSYDLQYRVGDSGDFTAGPQDVAGPSEPITGLAEDTEYEVQVQATNDEGTGGWSDSGSGATDANAAPLFTSPATFDAAENQTAVGTVTATDSDSDDSVTGYTIEGGADASTFSIVSATGVLTFTAAPNFEAPADADGNNNYVVVVRATSGTGARVKTADQPITVTVTDVAGEAPGVPDAPTVSSASVTSVTVTWAAPSNEGPAITSYDLQYRVGDSGDFIAGPQDVTGPSEPIPGLAEDTEYQVQVRATNDEGDSGWSEAGSGSTDANAAPVFSTSATFTAAENQTAVGTVTATDSDSDDSVTGYTIEGGADQSTFSIVSATGVLTFTAAPNFEAPTDGGGNNNYVVVVRATSGTGERAKTANQTIAVTVTDVDGEAPGVPDAPTVSSASVTSVTVTWTAPSNEGPPIEDYDYQYRVTAPQGSWVEVTDTTSPAVRATIEALAENTEYDVQVRATNAEGTGEWSASGSGTTDANATTPGITVSKPALTVTEEDPTGDSYTVVLDTQPTADVTVTVAGHAGTAVTPTPTTLTFTTSNWNTAQPVTVTAGNDADTTNDTVTLTHRATSTDSDYSGIAIADVAVTVNDNDSGNTPATGKPAIFGTAQVGSTLSVETSGIKDLDGKTKAENGDAGYAYSYQWIRVDEAKETDITGATLKTYTLAAADEGKTIKVQVSFTDDEDNPETLTSDAYSFTDQMGSPTGLTAIANGPYQIDLSWTAPVDNGGHVITGYKIESSETGNALTFTELESTTGNTTTYEHTGLLEVTTRYYRVRAINSEGTSEASNVANATTPTTDGTPSAPRNLQITPIGETQIKLSWDPPDYEDDNKPVTSYRIEVSEDNGTTWEPLVTIPVQNTGTTYNAAPRSATLRSRSTIPVQNAGTTCTICNYVHTVTPGTTYLYRVLAIDSERKEGRPSVTSGSTDANASPAFTSPATFDAAENQLEAVTVTATDSDAGDSVTGYTIEGGADQSKFSIIPLTGELTFTSAPNFEAPADADGNNDYVVVVRATSGTGARKKTADQTITVTVTDVEGEAGVPDAPTVTDAVPQAWIARFGRTAADQVLEAVDAGLRASRTAGMSVSLAGQRIGLAAPEAAPKSGVETAAEPGAAAETGSDPKPSTRFGGTVAADGEETARLKALSDWLRQETEEDRPEGWTRSLTGRELLMGSSFSLAAETDSGGFAGLWGRMAQTRFAGREDSLSLDGEVTTGLLGADYASGRWTTGLVVSHSIGEGGYRGEGSGDIEVSVTALTPWAGYAVTERLSVWGAAGYGAGELKLTPGDDPALKTDLGMTLAAAGARGTLIDGDGPKLDAVTDARWVRTTTARVSSASDGGTLASASAEVTRLRLGLEGWWPLALGEGTFGKGATVTPRLALGVRHDGGDAETGFGADIGGGVALAAPAHGLRVSLEGRGVLTHEAAGLRDRGVAGTLAWNPPPSGRGPGLTLTQSIGAGASGGTEALLSRDTLGGLAANDNDNDNGGGRRRLEARFDYGIGTFGDRFTMTPEIGLGLSDAGRDYSLGWRLTRAGSGAGSLELSLRARRRESANGDTPPEHGIGFSVTARW